MTCDVTSDVGRYYLQNTKNDFEKAEAHYKRSLEVLNRYLASHVTHNTSHFTQNMSLVTRHTITQVDGNRVATLCNYAALMKVMMMMI